MAPGIDPAPAGGRTFRRSLSARIVSATALALFGLAVASRALAGDFGAGSLVLIALVLVSAAGIVSAWGDRVTIDRRGVESRNLLLARMAGGRGRLAGRLVTWAEIVRVQEHRRPGAAPSEPPRALFLVPARGRRLALDSLEDFDEVVVLVRRAVSSPPGDRLR